MRDLDQEYYEWLCSFTKTKVNRQVKLIKTYEKLLEILHYHEFISLVPHDENRIEDGLSLRWRFSNEKGVKYNPTDRCSILEMLVALSLRCEEQIMDDPEIGNRTSHWFWLMVRNMGLFKYSDDKFKSNTTKIIEEKIDKFVNREYNQDGKGGLFIIDNCKYDLRKVEIWYQMCWYLDELI